MRPFIGHCCQPLVIHMWGRILCCLVFLPVLQSAAAVVHDFEEGMPPQIYNTRWSISTTLAYSGVRSLRSEAILEGQSSSVFVRLSESEVTSIRFRYTVSDRGIGRLSLRVDGEEVIPRIDNSGTWYLTEVPAIVGNELEVRAIGTSGEVYLYIDDLEIETFPRREFSWTESETRATRAPDDVIIGADDDGHSIVSLHAGNGTYWLTRSRWDGSSLSTVQVSPFYDIELSYHASSDQVLRSMDNGKLAYWYSPDVLRIHSTRDLSVEATYVLDKQEPVKLLGDFDADGSLDALATSCSADQCLLTAFDIPSKRILWTAEARYHTNFEIGSFINAGANEIALGAGQILDLATGTHLSDFPLGFPAPLSSASRGAERDYLLYQSGGSEVAVFDPLLNSPIRTITDIYSFTGYEHFVYFTTAQGMSRIDVITGAEELLTTMPHAGVLHVADIGGTSDVEVIHLRTSFQGILGIDGISAAGQFWSYSEAESISPDAAVVYDLDDNGTLELISVANTADALPVIRDLRTLEPVGTMMGDISSHPQNTTASCTILAGHLGVSPGRSIVVVRRMTIGTRVEIYDAASRELDRIVLLEDSPMFSPQLLPEREEMAAVLYNAPGKISLSDGSSTYMPGYLGYIFDIAVDQLDLDEAPEVAFLDGPTIIVADAETHEIQWSLTDRSDLLATGFRRVYGANREGLTSYDSIEATAIKTIPLRIDPTHFWVSDSRVSPYAFVIDQKIDRMQIIDVPNSSPVEVVKTPGISLSVTSKPIVLDLEGGLVLLAVADHALLKGEMGSPRLPQETPVFRSGFE